MKQIPITVNIYTGTIMQPGDATKIATKDSDKPQFHYGDKVVLCVSFVDNDGEAVALGVADSFEASLDTNFLHTDELMAYSANSQVDISGDWADIDRATGKISIRLDCETTGFAAKLSATQNIAPYLEIKRYVDGDGATVCQHKIVGKNNVHLDEGTPTDADPDYRTATAQDSIDQAKADKVSDATSGNFAGLDSNGNLTDSGKSPDSFDASGTAASAVSNHNAATDAHSSLFAAKAPLLTAACTDAASSANVGRFRYRTDASHSYCDMCMQTGASSYAWINITTIDW